MLDGYVRKRHLINAPSRTFRTGGMHILSEFFDTLTIDAPSLGIGLLNTMLEIIKIQLVVRRKVLGSITPINAPFAHLLSLWSRRR